MSKELADKLMSAESPESFLAEQEGKFDWQTMAALKAEVDRLAHNDLNVASLLVDRIERVARLTGEPLSNAFAEAGRARLLHLSGHYSEANKMFDGAIKSLLSARLRAEAAAIQKQRVDTLTQLGRYDDALSTARSARRALRHTELAQLEANVGNIYYRMDRYRKALEHYDRARNILASNGNPSMRAIIDGNRSNIFLETDRPDEALRLLESATATWKQTGENLAAAQGRSKIAYVEFLRGNYNSALASYYPVRDQLEAMGSDRLVAWCNLEIGEVLLALNSFSDAAESAQSARARFGQLSMPYESAQSTTVLALAEMGLRQFEQAQGHLAQARTAFEESGNSTFVALIDSYLAQMALHQGDAEDAARRAESSLRVFARQKLSTRAASARLIAAHAAHLSGNLTKASRMAHTALRTVEGVFAPGVVYKCHHLIGKIERERGRRRQALENFRRAVETVEQMRGGIAADEFKATFLRDKIEIYEDAIASCLDEESDERLEEAFRLVESSKSRALADLLSRYLRSSQSEPVEGEQSEIRARLLKLIEELNWYSSRAGLEDDKGNQRNATVAERHRREVRRCERQIAQLFSRLETEDSAFAEMQLMKAASSVDLRSALEEGETAIEYFITGDEVSAFLATREGVRLARGIASKREVEHLLAALRFQIEKFNFGSDYVESFFGQLKRATDDYLARLQKHLFTPLEHLVESEQIVVIPHGALHYVPFHALRDDGGYMIDRFEISYAPSAAVLKLCRAVRHQSDSFDSIMVALGVTHRDTPNIVDEIRELGSLFPDSVTLIGEEATRDNLFRYAPQARFLHLASHGYFRRDNPMFSFLKLADSPLNFYSLLDLRLRAEMVTLSACHTGVNMVFPGDELHGLMRGFLYAGAPSLVASLWAVSDSSTAELMSEMYRRIGEGESKRKALRMAQLQIKDDYGHPYYWAPFVLMGNTA